MDHENTFPPLCTITRKNGSPNIAIMAATGVSNGAYIVLPMVSASNIKIAPTMADIGKIKR